MACIHASHPPPRPASNGAPCQRRHAAIAKPHAASCLCRLASLVQLAKHHRHCHARLEAGRHDALTVQHTLRYARYARRGGWPRGDPPMSASLLLAGGNGCCHVMSGGGGMRIIFTPALCRRTRAFVSPAELTHPAALSVGNCVGRAAASDITRSRRGARGSTGEGQARSDADRSKPKSISTCHQYHRCSIIKDSIYKYVSSSWDIIFLGV